MKAKTIIIWLIVVGLVVWFLMYAMTPPPGTHHEDQGRKHVTEAEVAAFAFNSTPPTSGSHLETWVKPGIYTVPQSKGELIHALEHGYIEIHYNCNVGVTTDAVKDASTSATNASESCTTLQSKLEEIARKKKLFKLLVVPNPEIETSIVLAAWTYTDTLSGYDEKRIVKFIDYHRDHGPEQTME